MCCGVYIQGVNPMEMLKLSQDAIDLLTQNLERSANVGIGYAFSAEYVREGIKSLAIGQ